MAQIWLPIAVMAAAILPGWGQAASSGHYAISPGQVARALSVSGITIEDAQVSLLARVVSSEPDPALDIVSVESAGKGNAARPSRVRLACHVPGQCLPFYAMVKGPLPPSLSAAPVSGSEFTMRAGAHATLVMDDARAHIQVRVITLENGTAGKWIRASSLDHKQIYFGEVVSAGLLKGSF